MPQTRFYLVEIARAPQLGFTYKVSENDGGFDSMLAPAKRTVECAAIGFMEFKQIDDGAPSYSCGIARIYDMSGSLETTSGFNVPDALDAVMTFIKIKQMENGAAMAALS